MRLCRRAGDPSGVIATLNNLAVIARNEGDLARARSLFAECVRLSEAGESEVAIGRSLSNLAHFVTLQGERAEARSLHTSALSVFEKVGDLDGTAWSLSHLGDVAREDGDLEAARTLYERALKAFHRAEDPRGVATTMVDLGSLAGEQDDHAAARGSFAQALTLFQNLGHRRGIARALDGFATSAAAEGQAKRALRLAGAASAIRHTVGNPLQPIEESRLDQRLELAHQALSPADASSAGMEGWSMSIEQAMEYAQAGRD